ncbi:MAG: hypothetical protein AAGI38_15745 [Bacteroidota bacterium]
MVRFILRILLIFLLAYLVGRFVPLPWQTQAGAAFLGAILLSEAPRKRAYGKKKKHRPMSFWAGFIAIFILWSFWAFWLNSSNDSILADQIFRLIVPGESLKGLEAVILILATGLIGGLVGGFSSLTGNLLGEVLKRPSR